MTERIRRATRPGEKSKVYKTPDGWDTSTGEGGHGSFHKDGREEGYTGYKHKTIGPNSRMRKNRDPNHPEDRNREDEWDSSVVGNRDPERHVTETQTVGWTDCGHNQYQPGRVLDPFGGSGTVGYVAAKLKRDYVLIEMNPGYVEDIASFKLQEGEAGVPAKERKQGQQGLFDERVLT